MHRGHCANRVVELASIVACLSFAFTPFIHVSHAMGMHASDHQQMHIDSVASGCESYEVVQKTDCIRCCLGQPVAVKESGATLQKISYPQAIVPARVCCATNSLGETSCIENDMRGSPVLMLSTQKRE